MAAGGVAGFTLVELLLSTALLMVLLGALVLSFSTIRQGAELDEGSDRFETLVQLARAHSANTGRKVQISFEADEPEFFAEWSESIPGKIRLSWEPEPLNAPGVMLDLTEPGWNVEELNELVGIDSVRPLGGEAPGTESVPVEATRPAGKMEEEPMVGDFLGMLGVMAEPWQPIQFYPDGSCDSVEVILISRDSEDKRRVSMQIVGVTGQVRRTVLQPDAGYGSMEFQKSPLAETLESVDVPK